MTAGAGTSGEAAEARGSPATVERTARLFEAGRYPDRRLDIGPGELDAIAGAFSSPAPVLVEHLDGPLRLGWLTRVWREGTALFGRLVFSRAAWELMRECGARALSLGLERDSLRIREVSLVSRPRVAGARVFSEPAVRAAEFHLDLDEVVVVQLVSTAESILDRRLDSLSPEERDIDKHR